MEAYLASAAGNLALTAADRFLSPTANNDPAPTSASLRPSGPAAPSAASLPSTIQAPPPAVPSSASLIASPIAAAPSLLLPFQFHARHYFAKEQAVLNLNIAARPEIIEITRGFRRARLVQLDLIVSPADGLGITRDHTFASPICWHPANVDPASREGVLSTPGAQIVTYTGATTSGASTIVSAPLNSLNPMIKDSVAYIDTPALTVRPYGGTVIEDVPVVQLWCRGLVEVSAPALVPLV
jgi:hypothetical protein